MFKKCKVVMLPTNEKAVKQGQLVIGTGNYLFSSRQSNNIGSLTAYELYITSDEEIKEDYYFYCSELIAANGNKNSYIFKCKKVIKKKEYINHIPINIIKYDTGIFLIDSHKCKKIIATTDTSLKIKGITKIKSGRTIEKYPNESLLPQPSQQFIEKYIEEYNKGNIITDVLVEYIDKTLMKPYDIYSETVPISLKINSNDNTITIKKVKDSWTREEVIFDIKRIILLEREYRDKTHHFVDNIDLNDFIIKNL